MSHREEFSGELPKSFPLSETTFLLPSETGHIEVLTHTPETQTLFPAVAIICHPHPLFGGTMHNKVVSTLMRTFRELGLRTVRFNFRGVGKSTGSFDHGVGEVKDVFTLIQWVKTVCPHDAIWLSGFSFGAYVSALVASQYPETKQLVSIAPPVARFPLEGIVINCPWILVQGEKDDVVLPEDVFAWVEKLNPKPDVIKIPEAGHFFHGQLGGLRRELEDNLKRILYGAS